MRNFIARLYDPMSQLLLWLIYFLEVYPTKQCGESCIVELVDEYQTERYKFFSIGEIRLV